MAGQTRITRACMKEVIVRVSWTRLVNIASAVCAEGAWLAGHARQPGLASIAEVAGGLLVARHMRVRRRRKQRQCLG